MNPYFERKHRRERFLAEQQTQLARDAMLPDPAEAYRALIEELSEDRDGDERSDQAA